MPTLSVHSLTFRRPHTFSGAPDVEPTFEDNDKLFLILKTPIGDAVPTAPVLHATMTASTAVDLTATQSDSATIRTTQYSYSYNTAWTVSSPLRYADASAPFPALPTNVYNIEFKDQRDTAQGYTQQIYFTV